MRALRGIHAQSAGQAVNDLAADADLASLLQPGVPRDAYAGQLRQPPRDAAQACGVFLLKVLLIGMIAFTVCSLLVGLAPSTGLLVVLRALQGIAAATMSPSALSIVLATFAEGHQRNQALGYWSMVATGGTAVGLLLGGVLTQYTGCRWNFFINVPVGVAMSLVTARVVPAHQREEARTNMDAPGAVLVTVGLMAMVFYFSQTPTWGWGDARTLGALVLAAVFLAALIVNEQRTSHPLMTLSIFKIRNLSGANLMMAAVYAGNLGMFFLMTLYLQDVEHYSAIKTGLAFLPFPLILGCVSSQLRRLILRHGYSGISSSDLPWWPSAWPGSVSCPCTAATSSTCSQACS